MPNEGVKALLEPTDVNDLTLFPPQEQIEKGVFQEDVGDAIDIYEKYWHLLKTN